ncbi:hypothetical protein YPPY12_2400, partial [Yersinia pestis PY-12]
MPACCR